MLQTPCLLLGGHSQLPALLCGGQSCAQVVVVTRYSYQGAGKTVDASPEQGLEGTEDRRHNPGASTLPSDAELLAQRHE